MRGDRMTDQEAAVLAKASYARCSTAPEFFGAFYQRFFTLCPAARPMFAKTDFDRQHRLLRHAFGLLLTFPAQRDGEPRILSRVAERHSRRDLAIDPAFYPLFIDSLIDTVKQYDYEFTPTVEGAWRTAVVTGVEYMQSKY
jgi:hemoglobin-like flavoprotein